MAAVEAPKHHRGFSFHSDKSHKSSGSKPKIDYKETHKEKEAHRIHTHADPNAAISAMQPCEFHVSRSLDIVPVLMNENAATDALESSNMQSLRAIQHKDRFGNPIGQFPSFPVSSGLQNTNMVPL
jgi:hypothetical protein